MARKRIIKETPLEDGQQTTIDLSTGGKMEFPEPAMLTEEAVELDSAEAVLVKQIAIDKQEARQQQETQEPQQAQSSSIDRKTVFIKDQIDQAEVAAAHSTAEKLESLKETIDAQQEELQRLMNLPLSQIELLPQEQQDLIWQELSRQIVEQPGFIEGLQVLSEAGKRASNTIEQIMQPAKKPLFTKFLQMFGQTEQPSTVQDDRLQQMTETATRTISGISAAMNSIRRSIANLLSDDTLDALKTWGTLAPYIEAEADAHPEKYGEQAEEPATANELIAGAAHRAREDGKEIPHLKAEDAEPQQLQFEFPEKELNTNTEGNHQPEETPAEPSPLSLARKAGTITSLGDHVATIADKMLQYCFTSRDLKGLPGEHDNFLFDSAGKLNEFSLNGQPLQPLDDIHTGFLMALLQMANICDIREYNSKDNPSLGVYLPAFFREAHIDPRPRQWDKQTKAVKKRQRADDQTIKQERLQRFIEFMKPLDNRVGIIQGEGYYTVARFLSWDEATDTAFIAIPFEIKLAEIARLHADRHSAISTIFRADILTENQAAVELANRIAVGLIERGVTTADRSTYQNDRPRKPIKKKTTKTAPDGTKTVEELTFAPEPETTVTKTRTDKNGVTTTVTGTPQKKKTYSYRVRFSTLIADCPQLQQELAEIRNGSSADKSQRINKKLKDTFTAAIRIIMEKSDIPKYYAGVEVKTAPFETFKAPTNSTINSSDLVITHKGKNPAFAG